MDSMTNVDIVSKKKCTTDPHQYVGGADGADRLNRTSLFFLSHFLLLHSLSLLSSLPSLFIPSFPVSFSPTTSYALFPLLSLPSILLGNWFISLSVCMVVWVAGPNSGMIKALKVSFS